MYILYNVNARGYFTLSSTYSSDWKEGKPMEHEAALAMARRHKSQAGYAMIPVALADLEALA